MDLIQHWIAQYGYLGISTLLALGIVGLPVPDETLLTFAGYLVFRGELRPLPVALSALGGSITGITISYVLGRTAGYPLIHRYGRYVRVTDREIGRAHDFYHRIGGLSLTFGYYIAGVRHFTAFVAGASRLEFPWFAAYAWSGALIWCSTFLALGYFLGERWPLVEAAAHRYGVAALIVLAAGALLAALFWHRRGTA